MGIPVEHITEAELTRDVHGVLQRVESGAEVIVERDAQPIAVLSAARSPHRSISKSIQMAREHEEASGRSPTLDADFARDLEEIIQNRQPWNRSAWD